MKKTQNSHNILNDLKSLANNAKRYTGNISDFKNTFYVKFIKTYSEALSMSDCETDLARIKTLLGVIETFAEKGIPIYRLFEKHKNLAIHDNLWALVASVVTNAQYSDLIDIVDLLKKTQFCWAERLNANRNVVIPEAVVGCVIQRWLDCYEQSPSKFEWLDLIDVSLINCIAMSAQTLEQFNHTLEQLGEQLMTSCPSIKNIERPDRSIILTFLLGNMNVPANLFIQKIDLLCKYNIYYPHISEIEGLNTHSNFLRATARLINTFNHQGIFYYNEFEKLLKSILRFSVPLDVIGLDQGMLNADIKTLLFLKGQKYFDEPMLIQAYLCMASDAVVNHEGSAYNVITPKYGVSSFACSSEKRLHRLMQIKPCALKFQTVYPILVESKSKFKANPTFSWALALSSMLEKMNGTSILDDFARHNANDIIEELKHSLENTIYSIQDKEMGQIMMLFYRNKHNMSHKVCLAHLRSKALGFYLMNNKNAVGMVKAVIPDIDKAVMTQIQEAVRTQSNQELLENLSLWAILGNSVSLLSDECKLSLKEYYDRKNLVKSLAENINHHIKDRSTFVLDILNLLNIDLQDLFPQTKQVLVSSLIKEHSDKTPTLKINESLKHKILLLDALFRMEAPHTNVLSVFKEINLQYGAAMKLSNELLDKYLITRFCILANYPNEKVCLDQKLMVNRKKHVMENNEKTNYLTGVCGLLSKSIGSGQVLADVVYQSAIRVPLYIKKSQIQAKTIFVMDKAEYESLPHFVRASISKSKGIILTEANRHNQRELTQFIINERQKYLSHVAPITEQKVSQNIRRNLSLTRESLSSQSMASADHIQSHMSVKIKKEHEESQSSQVSESKIFNPCGHLSSSLFSGTYKTSQGSSFRFSVSAPKSSPNKREQQDEDGAKRKARR